MKIANIKNMEGETINFASGGTAEFKRIVNQEGLEARVVSVTPGSEVPGKNHKHDGHEMLFVISGNAQFYDGQNTRALNSGDSIVIEPFEQHWIVAGKNGISLFELVWP